MTREAAMASVCPDGVVMVVLLSVGCLH
jgi:hypothetical protein